MTTGILIILGSVVAISILGVLCVVMAAIKAWGVFVVLCLIAIIVLALVGYYLKIWKEEE